MFLAGPVSWAQQSNRIPVVGILASTAAANDPVFENFREGLRQLGYVEGKNIKIEFRSAQGQLDRLPVLAEELVRLKVDAILTLTPVGAQALKKATSIVPIVIALNDMVGLGLVTNLAHPGGNITGLSSMTTELHAKRLQLLKEAIPRVTRVAIVQYVDTPVNAPQKRAIENLKAAASSMSIELQLLRVTKPEELAEAFLAIRRTRAHALYLMESPLFYARRAALIAMVSKSQLPAVYGSKTYADEGGLMSFGASYADQMHRAAGYVDKILRGAKAADLPIEQPTKFELVVNLKTAKALGIAMPESILLQADEVIR
ncbi:MAG: ABC transporter substrate-binding protein [Betaproteobacteria bacterium]